MNPPFNQSQVRERHHQADSPVTAHSEIAGVVEEDDARRARRVDRFAEQCAYDCVRTARFVHNGGAKVIKLCLEYGAPPSEWACA